MGNVFFNKLIYSMLLWLIGAGVGIFGSTFFFLINFKTGVRVALVAGGVIFLLGVVLSIHSVIMIRHDDKEPPLLDRAQ